MSESLNDHLPLSPDHNAERLAALKNLFPDLFSNDGRLNVDELRKVVDPALVSETERYDFRWYGKTKSKREAFTPSRAALIFDPARSVIPEKAGGNMIIEGENLEVLKLLTSAYRERINCIYIDPPYNTGKDFIYSDNYAEGQKPYWEQTGVTENGVKVDSNTESDGRFHSNWLSMMQSRLLVARYLLKPEGIILVSIDDNELHNLRRVLDEVFGEENFIGLFVVNASPSAIDYGHIAKMHEYVLFYAKTIDATKTNWLLDEDKEFKYKDETGRFNIYPLYNGNVAFNPKTRPNLFYPFYLNPSSKIGDDFYEIGLDAQEGWVKVLPVVSRKDSIQRVWRWGKDLARQHLNGEIVGYKTEDGEFRVVQKTRHLGKVIRSLQMDKDISTRRGTAEFEELFGGKLFPFPKPVELIRRFISIGTEKDGIILDFFAGSGTTAQAVMAQNKVDSGNRQFMLVQLPELTEEDSPAHKAGFKRISDISIERAKRVVEKFKTEAQGLLPNDPQRQFADSLGFKVFTLTKSAFPRVEFAPDPAKTEAENIELLKQYIRDKEATFHLQFDKDKVLDEVLLKNGFMLDYTLTRQPDFKRNEVFLAKDAHKQSLVCLDAKLEPETVDYFKKHKEKFFICLELALDTTKKWNLKHNLGEKLKAI
ncbi:MAG: site-specific DNA-methyltransferase [Verrucomicrobiota bacterium]|jgi:adenine-specific DNA-methyltransferase